MVRNKKGGYSGSAVAAVVTVTSVCLCICVPAWFHSTTPERQRLPAALSVGLWGDGAADGATVVPVQATVEGIVAAASQAMSQEGTGRAAKAAACGGAGTKPRNQTVPLCHRPRLLVSILNARPQAVHVAWDNATHLQEQLMEDASLRAVLGKEMAADFHAQASYPASARLQQQGQGRLLAHAFQTIGAVQTACTINLAVYVPACASPRQSPSKSAIPMGSAFSQSYWQPGWGGVVMLPQTGCGAMMDTQLGGNATAGAGMEDVRALLPAARLAPHFVQFLRNLLGLCPRVPKGAQAWNESVREGDDKETRRGSGKSADVGDGGSALALDAAEVAEAQLVLLRRFVTSAGDLLTSFASLLDSLPTLVVDASLAGKAQRACDELQATAEATGRQDWHAALHHARAAHYFAEASAYDPGLLASSLFPEDQKYAVYVPLFVPTGVAILSAWRAIVAAWRQQR